MIIQEEKDPDRELEEIGNIDRIIDIIALNRIEETNQEIPKKIN